MKIGQRMREKTEKEKDIERDTHHLLRKDRERDREREREREREWERETDRDRDRQRQNKISGKLMVQNWNFFSSLNWAWLCKGIPGVEDGRGIHYITE